MNAPTDTRVAFQAANFATESENRIHSDDVARTYGFRGGLVPGVTSFAYVTEAIASHVGSRCDEWLRTGALSMRLLRPVYDGDSIVAAARHDGTVSLKDSAGTECVTGRFWFADENERSTARTVAHGIGRADVPLTRPVASEEALRVNTTLGTLQHVVTNEQHRNYLGSVNIDPNSWDRRGLVHPGVLILEANDVLARNVLLGPWIHVESTMIMHDSVPLGASLETRASVRACYERKGHALVELDVALNVRGSDVMTIAHTAIYRPRPVRTDA